MTRHEQREAIFKSIFQIPFYEDDVPELDYEVDFEASEKEQDYINNKVKEIQNNLEDIDKAIEGASRGWKVTRMGKSELAILRVAVYEILYDDDIPDKVAVNEAVELAKQYSDEKAASFINGVLSGVMKH